MVVGLWVEEAPHDPLVLEVGSMGAALGAHRVSTAVANPPALIKYFCLLCRRTPQPFE